MFHLTAKTVYRKVTENSTKKGPKSDCRVDFSDRSDTPCRHFRWLKSTNSVTEFGKNLVSKIEYCADFFLSYFFHNNVKDFYVSHFPKRRREGGEYLLIFIWKPACKIGCYFWCYFSLPILVNYVSLISVQYLPLT